MPHETQKGTNARSLLEQPSLAIAAGAVGLVGEQQATEVAFGSLFVSWGAAAKPFASAGWWWIVVETIDPLQ
jgi:hypothetical protein